MEKDDNLREFRPREPKERQPRAGKIVITIPDLDNMKAPIHIETEGPITLPETVFNLVTATNMLTLAEDVGGT